MSPAQTLTQALHAWVHAFMRRDMHNFMRFARDTGISMQQISALISLYHNANRGVTDIGDDLGVSSAAASQMIERLVQQGLLERSEDPNDRRAKQIVLTAKARELIEQSMQARQSWMEQLIQMLTPEQQEQIITSLTLLTETAKKLDAEIMPIEYH
jgi:MarR family transcriptional regulator for hemolysin